MKQGKQNIFAAKLSFILLLCWMFNTNKLLADHYYGGYFYYEVLTAKTYQITLVTYTDHHNQSSDRDSVKFSWGDNSSTFISRINNNGEGEEVYQGMKKNIYVGSHTYSELGNYKLFFSDNYRLFDVSNIALGKSGTTNLRFDGVIPIQDSSIYCQNNSPKSLTDPYFYGVQGQEISLNFAYWDADGDSLVYELISSLGGNGSAAEGYTIPSGASIHPKSGQFSWSNPSKGKYCFAFKVNEYRNGQLLGTSSNDFTLFISQIDYPKFNTGTGGIVSGTSNNEYRFLNPSSKEFIFSYTNTENIDSVVTSFKSPLSTLPFILSELKGTFSVLLKDTIRINYLGNYLLSGYQPVIWEVKTYYGQDSLLIQQFPLLIGVENDSIWGCSVADISKIYEVAPELPSLTISPNLFDDYVWINLGTDFANSTILIYDTRGRLVKAFDNIQQATLKLDLFELSSALYFLQVVKNNNLIYTGKMVKK